MTTNLSDDNEFARYLASYLEQHYCWTGDPEKLDRKLLEILIKEFMENLP